MSGGVPKIEDIRRVLAHWKGDPGFGFLLEMKDDTLTYIPQWRDGRRELVYSYPKPVHLISFLGELQFIGWWHIFPEDSDYLISCLESGGLVQ